MKRIIAITDIIFAHDSRNYEINPVTLNSIEAMNVALRNMTSITHGRYGSMSSMLVPDDNKQARLIEEGDQTYYGWNAEYAEQLFNYGDRDSVGILLTEIKHPDSILIVIDNDDYILHYDNVHDSIESAIIDDLLLSYLPMEFKYV